MLSDAISSHVPLFEGLLPPEGTKECRAEGHVGFGNMEVRSLIKRKPSSLRCDKSHFFVLLKGVINKNIKKKEKEKKKRENQE